MSEEVTTSLEGGPPPDPAFAAARPAIGDTVGRYTLRSVLGIGGMGTVYGADDPELDRRVAIKLLHPTNVGVGATARLVREGQALALISHPNVVAVYEAGRHGDAVFIAMELVAGINVAQWLSEPRTWREVLDVFIDAGRGLAAVHGEGLVHRDFKPGNVTIGADGAVKVLDFGLARALADPGSGSSSVRRTASEPKAHDGSPSGLLHTQLTHAGAVVGTPTYMAAEQFRGEAADHRADQHAFFVSLYEALYGRRPFSRGSWRETRAAVVRADFGPRPTSDAPRVLFKMILRGTSPDRERRYCDMNDVVARLLRIRNGGPRKRWIGAVAGVTAVGALGAWVVVDTSSDARCEDAEASLGGAWDGQRRGAVRAAFDRLDRPLAAGVGDRVIASLDDYAAQWSQQRRDACQADDDDAALDLRMVCLEGRREQLDSLSSVLGNASGDHLMRAMTAAQSLPRVAACGDLDALRAAIAPPQDAQVAQAVADLRRRLGEIHTQRRAGDPKAAGAMLAEVIDEAIAVQYAPVIAEARLAEAGLVGEAGDHEKAAELLEAVFSLADAVGHHEVAADAGVNLVRVVGNALGRIDDARAWARHAEGQIDRLRSDGADTAALQGKLHFGLALAFQRVDRHAEALEELDRAQTHAAELPGLEAALTAARATVYLRQVRLTDAKQWFERAVVQHERLLGPGHPELATVRSGLATVHWGLGDPDAALTEFRSALSAIESAFAEDNSLAGQLHVNIGNVLEESGRVEEATVSLRRGAAILERALGPDDPSLAIARGSLAGIDRYLGRQAEAVEGYASAARVLEAAGQTEALMQTLNNLGGTKAEMGDPHAGLVDIDRALAVGTQAFGAEHTTLATLHAGRGGALLLVGRHDDAAAAMSRALELATRELGDRHPRVAAIQIEAARIGLARGDLQAARSSVDTGLATLSDGAADPNLVGDGRLLLARIQAAMGEPEAAHQSAAAALAILADAGPTAAGLRSEAEAFIAER